ncbi:hypothetical protein N7536_004753 [Penicillium majusculum]|nr:hypothetical protein N7536_004753 [Penicillium majusculum]
MARNIDSWQRDVITHMLCSKKRLTTSQIAKNMRLFGSARSPPISPGRPPSITKVMVDALFDHLAEKPGLYVEEMAIFLFDEFNVVPSISSIKRALYRAGWSKKKAQQRASERNPQLRDFYEHKLSKFRSFHLVFVDKSGYDKRVGYRRTGWSPLGVTPI